MAVSPALPEVGQGVRVGFEGGPTPPKLREDGARARPPRASTMARLFPRGERIDRLVLAFVALGVVLRVGHYLSNYPLWGDEAFLAISFLRRGYLDLLLPLEYGQICPILFLWAELTAVKLFGFSEMSLRLCPLICGVGSVFLFRHVAGRVLNGPAVLMAVAIFAVSIHPIRHSADVKPYASDLLVALGLLALAIEWCVSPQRTGWLWLLVGFAPFALAASYPAVFVAGGSALALAASVWRTRRRGPRVALAAYVLVVATTFAVLFIGYVHGQRGASLPAIQAYWADSFPPLDSPIRLASWLVTTHAGNMFAYPVGGGLGASSLTLILVLIAAIVLWRRGHGTILALLVMPMGVALSAAALKLYPYGGEARIMQYIAPAVCLLTGLASSTLLGLLPRPTARAAAIRVAVITLAVMGIVALVNDFRHPYRCIYEHQAREFARRFWPEQARGAELACLQWDLGIFQRGGAVVRTAIYMCNQHIYSPKRRRGLGPRWALVTPDRPLRCVSFDAVHLKGPEATAWLESMKANYNFRGQLDLVVPITRLDMKPGNDHVFVFEFQPKSDRPIERVVTGIATDRTTK
jgi:Dolichyl-phosphate-mannose-protein mannosyltransferase